MKTNELFSSSPRTSLADPNFLINLPEKIIHEYPFNRYTNGHGVEFLKCDFKNFSNKPISLLQDISNKYVFIFNMNDKLHLSNENIDKIAIPKLHNLLYYNENCNNLEFHFLKGNRYKFCLFVLDGANFDIQEFVEEHSRLYFTDKQLLYKASPNLRIMDYVYKLLGCKQKFPDNLISLGYINIIIGLLINQYIDSKKGVGNERSCLREWEILALQKITEEIREKPEQNYAIKSLAKQSGVSVPKLQQGFKEMHGHTIANFIREVRLLKAEELLKHSDLNVSEVVYSVGLCSRSYFSRIFKKKFKCTPTDYQRKQYSLAVTA